MPKVKNKKTIVFTKEELGKILVEYVAKEKFINGTEAVTKIEIGVSDDEAAVLDIVK